MSIYLLVQKLKQRTPINVSTLQDKQNEWSFYGFSSIGSKGRTNKPNHFHSLKTYKMNGYFMGFRKLAQRFAQMISADVIQLTSKKMCP